MAKRQPQKKTTADTVSAARKLDHLMMLLAGAGTRPSLSAVKRAIETRDKIYGLIDEQNVKPDLKFETPEEDRKLYQRTPNRPQNR